MSTLVGIKKLTEISSQVVTWIDVSTITASIGTSITSIAGREGKDSATLAYGAYNLQLDADGYRCLRTNAAGALFQTASVLNATNTETFISVMNTKGNYQYATGIHDGISISCGSVNFSYGNVTVGSGRILQNLIQNKKVIVTGVMTPTAMYFYNGLTLMASLANPATLSGVSRNAGVFRVDNNPTNVEIDHYCGIRIQEALSGDRLIKAIRSVAFENGIKV